MSLLIAPPAPAPDSPSRARTHRAATLLRLFLAVVLATAGSLVVSVAAAGTANAASGRLTDFDNRMLVLVNQARSDAGVVPLKAATGLVNLSVMWSSKMADGGTNNQLQHNPDAFDQVLSYGASNRTAWAENVAKWSPTSVTADEIFAAYMASPGHKANILGGAYRYIGIGSVTGSNGASWNTMTFTDKVDPGQAYAMPRGSTDSVTVTDGTIRVNGWAFDPNSSGTSIPVHVYVNGAFATQFSANGARKDVNSAYGISGNHGFDGTTPAVVGNNTVCVFALSVTGTDNTLMLCKDVNWNPTKPPAGSVDEVSLSGSTIAVRGWTYDPQNAGTPNKVTVAVNGADVTTVTANDARPDVNAAFKIAANHGFSASLPARSGANQVCVTATTVNGAASADLGCKTVTYTPPQPAVGAIDGISRSGNGIAVSGWAFDPSAKSTSNQVHVYVNGVGTALVADKSRNDVNAAFGLTGNHGYANTVPAPAGSAEVCLFSISMSGGDNTLLGCRTLAAAKPTFGSVDVVQRVNGGVRVAGWAVDPTSPSATIPIDVYVNGVGTRLAANDQRNDVNAAYGVSGQHGYDDVVGAPSGSAQVCVFAISVSGGTNTLMLCKGI